MSNILFAESIDLEFSHIMESFENSISYANATLMEETTGSFFIEASGGKESGGGLFGFIKRIFDSILKMLSDAGKKIKSIFTGASLTDEAKDKEMTAGRDPKAVEDFMNGYIPSAKKFLNKCASGEVSMDEAKRFVEEKKASFSAISTLTASVASFFGISIAQDKIIGKWKADLEEAYEATNATLDASLKLVRTKGGTPQGNAERQKIIKETTAIVLNQMASLTGESISGIEKIARDLYAKNYVKTRLTKESNAMADPKQQKQIRKEAKKKHKASEKEIEKLRQRRKDVANATEENKDIRRRTLRDKARVSSEENKTYLNSNKYVDKDEIKGKFSFKKN